VELKQSKRNVLKNRNVGLNRTRVELKQTRRQIRLVGWAWFESNQSGIETEGAGRSRIKRILFESNQSGIETPEWVAVEPEARVV